MNSDSTPHKPRRPVNNANIDATRNSILQEIGAIIVYKLEDIIGSVLPPVSNTELDSVKIHLKLNAHTSRAWLEDNLSCKGFGRPSKVKPANEAKVFNGIQRIFNAVAAAVKDLGFANPTVFLVDNPTRSLTSEEEATHKSRPDATYILITKGKAGTAALRVDAETYRLKIENYSWSVCAGTDEYKLHNIPKWSRDNAKKVIHSMNQVMGLDPCRTATFAFSFEDTQFRFFWCDRSGFLCSEATDYFEDLDLLLRIYIALAKASPEDLGFDPTVTRVRTDEGEKFHITTESLDINNNLVSEKWETVRWLSNIRADWIIGRATRVWEVRRIDPPPDTPNATKVLKDIWIDPTRVSEGARYRQITQWIYEHPEYSHMANHFFTLHSEGTVLHRGKVVSTFETLRGGLKPASGNEMILTTFEVAPEITQSFNTVNARSHGPVLEVSEVKKRAFAKLAIDRKHSRLIFNEVGKRVDELRDFGSVYRSLIGASRALQVLQAMGIVHRDISTGNVMWVDGIGKLMDLEFCIEYDRESGEAHADITGTPYFMSAEVLNHEYLWAGNSIQEGEQGEEEQEDDIDVDTIEGEMLEEDFEMSEKDEYASSPFRQNYIHDGESLWWILMFFLLTTYPMDEPGALANKAKNRRHHFDQFFPMHNLIAERQAFGNPFHVERKLKTLRDSKSHPTKYRPLIKFTSLVFRNFLVKIYQATEKGYRFDPAPMEKCHERIEALLCTMEEKANSIGTIELITEL